jgi:hypothetical protein
LNLTEVAPVSVVPVITTLVPTGPLAGLTLLIFGATMKLLVLVAVPKGVVTETGPVEAAAGTVAVIWVEELTVNGAIAPLNRTDVAPVSAVPVIATLVPTGALVGLKPVIAGATVKLPALVAVPPGVVTEIGPVGAPAGTVAVI